ncbi:MAG: tRNA (adenosine(37)-N6)-threonylcarbamoyltransferase complex transferase subunit TsaD [Clostridiales bacterium]|jgi:N6-L-threonylcarbamoyladenine synthase|nr:tRNA (adenosine(37)-N6)-threonylcarbamoyltransferase complex transferase subunit TsaD [Clostridiales bacterium]
MIIKEQNDVLILGIETSCDETSAAMVKNGREVLSNIISSQIDIHKRFGGVVPEIASRNHTMAIVNVLDQALSQANIAPNDIDAVAVTYGAGLVGALLVGVSAAKAISYLLNKPLIAVDHIRAHIAANYLDNSDLVPPFLCAVVSGGHTELADIKDYTRYEILGATLDDAAGEAFDKVARALGLGYPGGPEIDKRARLGKRNIEFFKTAKIISDDYNFSYSGLKTAVINYLHNARQRGQEININDICASFTYYALEPIVQKAFDAARNLGYENIALAGGVAANSYLRRRFKEMGNKYDINVYVPSPKLCTDNAAMVASMGYYNYINKVNIADMTLNAAPSL